LNRTQGKGKREWVAFPGAVQGSVLRKEGHLGEIRARSGRIPFYPFRFWQLSGVMLDSAKPSSRLDRVFFAANIGQGIAGTLRWGRCFLKFCMVLWDLHFAAKGQFCFTPASFGGVLLLAISGVARPQAALALAWGVARKRSVNCSYRCIL
jgi:hypothetical protein